MNTTGVTLLAALAIATPAAAQQAHDHAQHHAQPAQPDHAQHLTAPAQQPDHGQMDHSQHQSQPAPDANASQDMGGMEGLLGAYAMGRDASGTSWQPDASTHGGVHAQAGEWRLMGHAAFNAVYDWQDGPRGNEEAFLSGMVMGAARRDFTHGTLNFRIMASPDPFMGKDGYPLLFAAGETANGVDTLVDRQHPHDLLMELSASYSHRLSNADSLFVYAGLPGEPAFGPPAFMHRLAAMDSPEAPITHHWFDSTHITFGVVTAGWVHDDVKLEVSQFRGREPDQDRFDIESGALDSTSARLSWNPTENLALQASWADVESPEALHPDDDEERLSASAIYTRALGGGRWWSLTGAFANKEKSDGTSLDAWLGEAALHPNQRWTIFARGERIETDELDGHHGDIRTVGRLSLGAIRDFRVSDHAVIGIGALAQQHFAPDALETAYGGDPQGAMAFLRLKIG
ncbi:hypothetical protein U91I_02387 [alpha proteobacterium U9-1i]|nr:hypothetical protein U91I_02387 [alpha proteobacterium U9-1i]